MAGFRGFGDDAIKVQQDQMQFQAQMAQVSASKQASARAASVALAGQAEQGRQADMVDAQATAKLASEDDPNSPSNATKLAESRARTQAQRDRLGIDQQNVDIARKGLEQSAQQHLDTVANQTAERGLHERQLQLNEATYARVTAEAQKQQAAQDELAQQDTAAQLAVIRAASVSTGPLGMAYINSLNNVRGVAYGDPGSVTQVFPVIDPNTGARMGIGTVKIGNDGKAVQSVLDPATILPKVRASMTADKWEEYARKLIAGNTAKGSDRFTAATMKEMQEHNRLKLAATDPGTLMKTLSEKSADLAAAKPSKAGSGKTVDPANQADFDNVNAIQSNLLKTLKEQSADETPTAGAKLSPEQTTAQADFVTPPSTATKPQASLTSTGELSVTIDGKTGTMPDTPKNRARLQEQYGVTVPEKTNAVKKSAPSSEASPDTTEGWTGFPTKHPTVKNEDGSHSNVLLGSGFEYEMVPGGSKTKAIVYPTMVDGKRLSDDEAKKLTAAYIKKGAKYPTFNTMDEAEAWARENHAKIGEDGKFNKSSTVDKSLPTGSDATWKAVKRGTPLIETDMNTQKSGRNKLPSAVSGQFTKVQADNLTDDDKKALQEIHAASLEKQIDPDTKLTIDPAEYRKQKTREYFKNKKARHDEDFNRLFGNFLK